MLKLSNIMLDVSLACVAFEALMFGALGVSGWVVLLTWLVLWAMGASFLAGAGLRVAHYGQSLAHWAERRRG